MAKLDIQSVNFITSGTKQNTFNISYTYTNDGNIHTEIPPALSATYSTTLFGDIGTEESMSDTFGTNKSALYDENHKFIIHSLYKLDKTPLRTTADVYGKEVKQDFYLPAMKNDLQLCQLKNHAYALTKQTSDYPIEISTIFNNSTIADYSYYQQLSSHKIDTFLYPTPLENALSVKGYLVDNHGLKLATENHRHFKMSERSTGVIEEEVSSYQAWVSYHPDLSAQRLSAIFSPDKNLKDMQYNYVLEIPEDSIDNRYDEGYIQANWFMLKNHLNPTYDMQVNKAGNRISVEDCREYVNLNACGGQLYATYRANDQYVGTLRRPDEQHVAEAKMIHSKSEYSYQHIEVIDSFHHYDAADTNNHKSSLYSLRLYDTGLNSSTIDDTVKMKLRKMITNNIRKTVEKLCPANTQLFEVYFKGK